MSGSERSLQDAVGPCSSVTASTWSAVRWAPSSRRGRPSAFANRPRVDRPDLLGQSLSVYANVSRQRQMVGRRVAVMGSPVAFFEVSSRDHARAQRFYAELFGWEV